MRQTILIMLLILVSILTGCGQFAAPKEQLEPNANHHEQKQTGVEDQENLSESLQENESSLPTEAENPEEQADQDTKTEETTPAYYVNEKNYIKALEPSDSEQKIALITIDDSPSGKEMEDGGTSTEALLDLLDQYNVKAIWFVNGHYADKNRELLKEISDRGHLIGNHTWWHENLSKLSPEKTREEIVSVNDLVEEVTGKRPVYFRAPFGVNSEEAYKVLKEENMQAMNWTWGSLDWELKTPEEIEANVVDHIHNGANILFHDKTITAQAMEGILKKLTEKGYQFVLPTEVIIKE